MHAIDWFRRVLAFVPVVTIGLLTVVSNVAEAEEDRPNVYGPSTNCVVKLTLEMHFGGDGLISGDHHWVIEAKYGPGGALLTKREVGSKRLAFEVYSVRRQTFVKGHVTSCGEFKDATLPSSVATPQKNFRVNSTPGDLGFVDVMLRLKDAGRDDDLEKGLRDMADGGFQFKFESIVRKENPLADFDVDGFVDRAVVVWENSPRRTK